MKKSFLIILAILFTLPVMGAAPEQGINAATLLRQLAMVTIVLAFVGLIVVEFVLKRKISRSTYKWSLFLGLFMFPLIALIGATTTLMDETTTVASCASCHNMHPFVNDLGDPESATLAARHYRNRYIPENQCYHCHTSYGVHGTFESKRDGFRHWLLYVTNTWQEPITFKGSYPNSNCLDCHAGTPKYNQVRSHDALKEKFRTNEVSCASCHGPVHPTPAERGDTSPRRRAGVWFFEDEEKLKAVLEFVIEMDRQASLK